MIYIDTWEIHRTEWVIGVMELRGGAPHLNNMLVHCEHPRVENNQWVAYGPNHLRHQDWISMVIDEPWVNHGID